MSNKISLSDIQKGLIKDDLKDIEKNQIQVAQRLQHIEDLKFYSPEYRDITEYAQKELDLDRRRVWELKKVVYRFCEPRKTNQYGTGYCVKSFFKDYSYSKLVLLLDITEEEIKNIGILPSMSWREIHKLVIDFKKGLLGYDLTKDLSEVEEETTLKINDPEIEQNYYDLKHSEMILSLSGCRIKGKSNQCDFDYALKELRNIIIHDNDNDYVVVKVKKGLGS